MATTTRHTDLKSVEEQVLHLRHLRVQCEQRAVRFEARAVVAENELGRLRQLLDQRESQLDKVLNKNRYIVADGLFRMAYQPRHVWSLMLVVLSGLASGLKKHLFKSRSG